ncbi:MAG: hypothetical protein ACOX75_04435 [Lachnospiraceae bacterium]|jgi:hypothetical protein
MKKTIVGLLLLVFCVTILASCAKKEKPVPYDETKTESQETEPAETLKKDLEPGIEGPEGWPEDVPTPVTGEFMGGAWSPDMNVYTVDIIYTQEDIDAYAERLQDAGFKKTDTDKYGGADFCKAYANDKWEILLADEGVNGDYTFIDLYPIK